MMNLTHWLRMSALCMLCLTMAALSGNAADNSATTDLSANKDTRRAEIVTFPLGINSTSRAVAMDVRNGREVKIGLVNASVTPFGITFTGRPFYGGDFGGNGVWYVVATPDSLYSVDTTSGALSYLGQITGIPVPVGSNTSGLTWDYSSNTMYMCNLSGGIANLYTLNLATRVATPIGPILTGTIIDIACSNTGQIYGIKFAAAAGVSDSLVSINKTTGAGTTVGPLGVDVNFAHGMDFDPVTDSLFYPGYIGGGVNNLYRINTTTGLATLVGPLAAGEYDCFSVMGAPPAGPDTLLVILQDTTTASVKRHADHDTLFTYLSSLVPTYRRVYIDTAGAALPSLTNYKKILYVETSFDAASTRWLGANSRQALKNWLNSGTPGNKKSLVMVGGDLAYNLSRPTSGGRDTVLAKDMLKFTYKVDNGNVTGQNSITGVNINNGGILTLNTAPAGSGFYPDGVLPDAAGNVLYRYTGRGASDTVASVGYAAPGYTAATLFADPRYFTVSGPNTGFGKALRDMLAYSGAITEVSSQTPELPNGFVLSQNYPNPFNPTTTIQFGLPVAADVTVKIYNVLGQEIATLVDGLRNVGTFQAVWDGRNSAGTPVASGMYFYSLVAKSADSKATYTNIKKMLLLK
jgi:hypothetical protein